MNPAKWANECFVVAKAQIYQPLQLFGHPGLHPAAIPLDDNYAEVEIGVVETQLKEAGVRLNAVLEASFRQ